jgi:hypothetical protein
MIEDMTIRKLATKTQQGCIRTIKDFAAQTLDRDWIIRSVHNLGSVNAPALAACIQSLSDRARRLDFTRSPAQLDRAATVANARGCLL